MAEQKYEKCSNDNVSDFEASLGEGITSNAMRRRALAFKVLSRRLEREKAFEQSKRVARGAGDALK